MPSLGDLERFAATSLYPWRFAIAAFAAVVVGLVIIIAARRGWFAAARRHPLRTGALVVAVVVVLAPAAWYLGSPLLIRTELVEPEPVAVIASPAATAAPSTKPARSAPTQATGPAAESTPAASPSAAPLPTPAPTPVVLTGRFTGADDFHFGRGRATLTVAADGSHTLRFENFSVRNGPDLFVYLSPDPAGWAKGAVKLGPLKATDGSFNTPIPAGTDVTSARSVVIWCKEFAVLFAVAPLDG